MPGNARDRQRVIIVGLSGCLLTLLMLLCVGMGAFGGLYLRERLPQPGLASLPNAEAPPPLATLSTTPQGPLALPTLPPTPVIVATPEHLLPTPEPAPTSLSLTVPGNPGLPVTLDQQPASSNAQTYLERLYLADHPAHDYYDTAVHLGKLDVGARTFDRPGFSLGDRFVFQTEDGAVEATLQAVTEHAYFWVDDQYPADPQAVQNAAARLEEAYYGRLSHLFDKPWAPGIDGDPRFSVLHLAGSGEIYELGYFSDQDEYPRSLFRDSNEQEIVYLNMGQLDLGSDLYFGTLVHELQHLFQWNLDKNEETWFNEGLSQLAELVAGLDTAVADPYLSQTSIPLNGWSYDEATIDAHYAASYLFLVYIWEQLGDEGVYELVRHPANGLSAVRSVLHGFAPGRDLEAFVADWATANVLDDPAAGSRYAYTRLALPPAGGRTAVRDIPFTDLREMDQFGVHYIDLNRSGPITLTFAGDTIARVIDAPPPSGEQMWYALPSNDSNAQLTAAFDLTQLSSATLTFNAWYDLELDFDYAYVSVSTDGGTSWHLLYPQVSRDGDYGPAISGRSRDSGTAVNGWLREQLSLSQFAGQEILVRFQVLTDFETIGRGFAIDDIAIPELGYLDDAEDGSTQWQAQGFVRTGWIIPQQWILRLILNGPQPQVIDLPLNALNQRQETIDLGAGGGILVILPVTPFVDETAQYWLHLSD